MDQNFVFCLFCETSYEGRVETFLRNNGFNVISALVERNIYKNGKLVKEKRSIIPGYVFFEDNKEPDWDKICEFKHIHYPLHYMDKSKSLKKNDLDFVNWLKRNNGLVKISKVMDIGKKIKIIEGPLKELEGNIVKINKKQKCIGVKIDGDGINNIIWLSYEHIM
jgi:transcriptional antiterminator NusG